jgi:inosine triphosphate pyrophosphatase
MRSSAFVTGNANKLKEVKAILAAGDSGIEVTSEAVDGELSAASRPQTRAEGLVPEVQGTTQEVAIAKCKAAAEQLGRACVTEDTALCFEALNGLPGPYIKQFMENLGHDGKYDTYMQITLTSRLEHLTTRLLNHLGNGIMYIRLLPRSRSRTNLVRRSYRGKYRSAKRTWSFRVGCYFRSC